MWQCLLWEEETQSSLQNFALYSFSFQRCHKDPHFGSETLSQCPVAVWKWRNVCSLSRPVPPQVHQQSGVHNWAISPSINHQLVNQSINQLNKKSQWSVWTGFTITYVAWNGDTCKQWAVWTLWTVGRVNFHSAMCQCQWGQNCLLVFWTDWCTRLHMCI